MIYLVDTTRCTHVALGLFRQSLWLGQIGPPPVCKSMSMALAWCFCFMNRQGGRARRTEPGSGEVEGDAAVVTVEVVDDGGVEGRKITCMP